MIIAIFLLFSMLPFLPALAVDVIYIPVIRILAPLLAAIWLIKGLIDKKVILPFSLPAIYLVSFLVFSGFSILWSENPLLGIRKLVLWISIFPLSAVFFSAISQGDNKEKLIKGLSFSAAVLSIFAVIQFTFQFVINPEVINVFLAEKITPLFVGMPTAEVIRSNSSWLVDIGGKTILRAVANFPDPHTLALFLGLAWPFVVSQAIFSNERKEKATYAIFSAAITAAIIFTFSRGAYLALLISAVSLTIFARAAIAASSKKTKILTFIVAVLALMVVGPLAGPRLASSFDTSEGSNYARLLIWQGAFDVFEQHLLFGVGLGNYALTQDEFVSSRSPINAHNTYLEIASELGLFGLLLWTSIFISSFFILLKKQDPQNNKYIYPAIAAMIFYLAHGLFETNIYSPQGLVLLTFILSLVMWLHVKQKETRFFNT